MRGARIILKFCPVRPFEFCGTDLVLETIYGALSTRELSANVGVDLWRTLGQPPYINQDSRDDHEDVNECRRPRGYFRGLSQPSVGSPG